MIEKTLAALVALLHFYFAYLEMFAWSTARGRRVFGTSKEQAAASAVLAANQGLYNACLGAGLLASLAHPAGAPVRVFVCAMIVVVGVYGAYSVNRRILWVQAAPAAAALAAALA